MFRAIRGFGDSYRGHADARVGHDHGRPRCADWQHGTHSLKFGGSYRWFIWPMWGFFQSRGYYQFTSGFTTQTATSDGTGSALASFLLGLPAVRQRQAGSPSMNLRQWYADAFVQDTWRITPSTTLEFWAALRVHEPAERCIANGRTCWSTDGQLTVFIGGQNGHAAGLLYPNKLRFAPRFGIAHQFADPVSCCAPAYGIFYTPVDMNTWCNQLHNAPIISPRPTRATISFPRSTASISPRRAGTDRHQFRRFDPHGQRSTSSSGAHRGKEPGSDTTLEIGYQGARGFHLQRAHLINNALPGPGPIQPRRPYKSPALCGHSFRRTSPSRARPFRQHAELAREYRAKLVRRRLHQHPAALFERTEPAGELYVGQESDECSRLPLADVRIERSAEQQQSERGERAGLRYPPPLLAERRVRDSGAQPVGRSARCVQQLAALNDLSGPERLSFTISVFGDTANAGTVLGENPIRANYNGLPVFGPDTKTPEQWFNTAAFLVPPAYTFGNVGRNTLYGPGMQTLDVALVRQFAITDRVSPLIKIIHHNNNHAE